MAVSSHQRSGGRTGGGWPAATPRITVFVAVLTMSICETPPGQGPTGSLLFTALSVRNCQLTAGTGRVEDLHRGQVD